MHHGSTALLIACFGFLAFLAACTSSQGDATTLSDAVEDGSCDELLTRSPEGVAAVAPQGSISCPWMSSNEQSLIEVLPCSQFESNSSESVISIYRREIPGTLELHAALTSDQDWKFWRFDPENFSYGGAEISLCTR